MTFFTSDTHWFHKALLPICRPEFSNVEDMHELMIDRWNKVVVATDRVWHLGDVTFGSTKKTEAIMARLNGEKHLVLGNHDHGAERWLRMGFKTINQNATVQVKVAGRWFLLSHFPYKEGATEWHPEMFIDDHDLDLICGHVHTSWRRQARMLNVGVELNGYTPVSEAQVAKEFGLTI